MYTPPPLNPAPCSISLPAVESLFLLFSEGIIVPLKAACCFAGHLCLWGTLLTAGLWKLVAISTRKFDCCREMGAISYHTPHGVQNWILPFLYSQPGSSPFIKTGELQSRGNIRWKLSLCLFPSVSGYWQWCWFHSMSDFTRLWIIS